MKEKNYSWCSFYYFLVLPTVDYLIIINVAVVRGVFWLDNSFIFENANVSRDDGFGVLIACQSQLGECETL